MSNLVTLLIGLQGWSIREMLQAANTLISRHVTVLSDGLLNEVENRKGR